MTVKTSTLNAKSAAESTEDIDEQLKLLYEKFESGELTPSAVRAATGILRERLNRIKIEMAACELGRSFHKVETREADRNATRLKAVG